MLHRKAEPEIIARKATTAFRATGAGSSAAGLPAGNVGTTMAPFAQRSSAFAQIHRSLKAWRSEDEKTGAEAPDAGAEKASDEKLEEPAAKSEGKDSAATNKSGAMDAGGADAKGGKAEGAESTGAAPAGEGQSEVKEEAPSVGTKLKVLAKRKDLSAAKIKEKEEEKAKQKELCLAKVELAKAKAEQTQKAVDLVAGLGVDGLITLAGPAAPLIMPIIKGVAGVVQDGTNIVLDAKRDFQAHVLTMAINTMSARQIKNLANNWTKVEPSLKEIETRLNPQVEQLKTAGLASGAAPVGLGIAKGTAVEGGKKVAEHVLEKWVPFVGTIMKIGELIATVNEVASLREKIEQLEEELA